VRSFLNIMSRGRYYPVQVELFWRLIKTVLFCSCIQAVMEILLMNSYEIATSYDAGSRHRSSHVPLGNEDRGIMDEAKSDKVHPMTILQCLIKMF
jgi:hypothetical protein